MNAPLHTLILLVLVLTPVHSYNIGLLVHATAGYQTSHENTALYAAAELANVSLVVVKYYHSAVDIYETCCKMVASNVTAVMSIGGSNDVPAQADIFSRFKIPLLSVVATDPFLNKPSREYLIRMSPSDEYQSEAIFELLHHYGWTEVSILASASSYGINGLVELQHLMAQSNHFRLINVLYFHEQDNMTEFNITEELSVIKESLSRVVVLNCEVKYGKVILQTAHKMGLLGDGFVWIVTDDITSQPEGLKINGATMSYYHGLIGVRPSVGVYDNYRTFQDNYLLEAKGSSNQDLTIYTMMTYDAVGFINKAFTQIPNPTPPAASCVDKSSWSSGLDMLKALKNLTYPGITGQISFTQKGESRKIVYDIVNFKYETLIPVGTWRNSSGIEINADLIFLGNRKKVPPGITNTLRGQHLKLGIKAEAPFAYLKKDNCIGDECWSGYCVDIVERLSKDLNFTYEYVKPQDNKWGGYNETTQEWNGIVGELKHRVIDMAAAPISANSFRKEVIDFSVSVMDAGIIAVVKGESGKKNKFFFLSPFEPAVWIAILLVNFYVTGLICLFNRLSPFGKYGAKIHAMQTCTCEHCAEVRDLKQREGCRFDETKKFDCLIKKHDDKDTKNDLNPYNSIWLISAGLVGKPSGTPNPYCMSSRFILFSWWFFMLIIIKMYTANLTAFMTVSKLGISLNTVRELLDQDEFSWGLIESRNPENLLLNHIDPAYKDLVEKGVLLESMDEAVQRVRNGKFVFIDESPVISYNLLKSDCDVFVIGDEFQTFQYAFGFPKNVPYISIINKYLMKYREEGLIDTLWKKWSPPDQMCNKAEVGTDGGLDMDTLAGIFYTVLVASCIGLVLIVLELIYASVSDAVKYDMSCCETMKLRLLLKTRDVVEEWFGVTPARQPIGSNGNDGKGIDP